MALKYGLAMKIYMNENVQPYAECETATNMEPLYYLQRGSFMVWEINIEVCPLLDFDNIMFFYCLGYNFNIYGAFEFLCNFIANL